MMEKYKWIKIGAGITTIGILILVTGYITNSVFISWFSTIALIPIGLGIITAEICSEPKVIIEIQGKR